MAKKETTAKGKTKNTPAIEQKPALQLKETIDLAATYALEIKRLEKQLEPLKKELKAKAKELELKILLGETHFVEFTDSSESYCNPKDLYIFLRNKNQLNTFWSLIKVLLTEAKKVLGAEFEDEFNKLIKKKELPYHLTSFKKIG